MSRLIVLALGVLATTQTARAACDPGIPIVDELSCSSEIVTQVDHTQPSQLGAECDALGCYSCGDPWVNQAQLAPEAVYEFQCQQTGEVTMLVTDMPCDLDIYVLDNTCDPYGGCVDGSTAPDADDSVTFTCDAGETYYIVVEAYGTAHLDISSNPCTSDGTSTGAVFTPTYTMAFDVSASTGCNEDCDDGADNDLDSQVDCDDPDCGADPVCCDLDDDGWFGDQCGGTDCDDDDPDISPVADEVEDGEDNDCDGFVDEGTDAFDDDGDGLSEDEGDCNDDDPDVGPHQVEIQGNGIDDDCDGVVDGEATEDTDLEDPPDVEPPTVDPGTDKPGCQCAGSPGPTGAAAGLGALFLLGMRRRT